MSVDLKALAQQLTETAEKQGFRIILEPISTHAESPEKAPTSPSEAISAAPMKNPIPNFKTDSETAKAIAKEVAKERKSWLTVAQAARMMEVADTTIRKWVDEGRVESKRDGILMVSTDVLNIKKWPAGNRPASPVYCIETETHFASKGRAARTIGVSAMSITRAIAKGTAVKGLHFCHDVVV